MTCERRLPRSLQGRDRLLLASLSFILLSSFHPVISRAQVTSAIKPDGTLGTTINQLGNLYNINGGTIKGANQFHSFDLFTVGTGDIASFNGPSGIANILSRVTGLQSGLQESIIDGTLRSTIPGANLFLMNPSGIVFGPNAILDIGSSVGASGSFYATTANVIRLGGGGEFFADPLQSSVLTSEPVVAFGFLGPGPPAPITVNGSVLTVEVNTGAPINPGDPVFDPADPSTWVTVGPTGRTLALIGGDITITGNPVQGSSVPTLSVPSGHIQIASLASPGEVSVSGGAFDVTTPGAQGLVTLSNGARLDVSENTPFTPGTFEGGTVVIRGGQLVVDNSVIFSNTFGDVSGLNPGIDLKVQGPITLQNASELSTTSFGVIGNGLGDAGDVRIFTPGSVLIDGFSRIGSGTTGPGSSGNISLNVGSLTVTSGSLINNFSQGVGRVGRLDPANPALQPPAIAITGQTVNVDGGIIETKVSAEGSAGAGTLAVNTANLNVTNGGAIQTVTESSTRAGDLVVDASASFLLSGEGADGTPSSIGSVSFGGTGATGDITVMAGSGTIEGGARIQDISSAGESGKIDVTTSDTLTLSGHNSFGDPSSILSRSAFGQSGAITVSAGTLNMVGGNIETKSGTSDNPVGTAGSLTITGNTAVNLSAGSRIASASFTGTAGDVTVSTPSLLVDNSSITASTTGQGNAGNVLLNAGTMTVTNGGTISTAATTPPGFVGDPSTLTGNAGNIEITTTGNSIALSNGGTITSASQTGGNAGNITITSASTFVMDNSSVTTAADLASGGQITITAPQMVQLTNSQIKTSVAGSEADTTAGNITIDPNFVILQNSQILAQAFAGTGGNIAITAGVFLADPSSLVSASSQLGVSGSVTIRSPVSNVAGIVARLPESVLEAQALLRAACAARLAEGQASSFVERGRDSIPVGPDGLLASPFVPPPPEPQQTGASFFEPGSSGGAASSLTSGAYVRRLLGMGPNPRVQLLLDDAACGL